MDKITDHLFIFEGEWAVKDFWWTYSEYKTAETLKGNVDNKSLRPSDTSLCQGRQIEWQNQISGEDSNNKKLSYMEKRELDQLTKDIVALEKERDEISRIFDQKDVAYDDIKELSVALWIIIRQLEQKEYRWFELSARE